MDRPWKGLVVRKKHAERPVSHCYSFKLIIVANTYVQNYVHTMLVRHFIALSVTIRRVTRDCVTTEYSFPSTYLSHKVRFNLKIVSFNVKRGYQSHDMTSLPAGNT